MTHNEIIAAERERCARICEEVARLFDVDDGYPRNDFLLVPQDGCDACAKAIREGIASLDSYFD